MNSLFAYGTLAQKDVQLKLIGRTCEMHPAHLDGYKACRGKWPYLVPQQGSATSGFLMTGLTDVELAKFDEYEEVEDQIYARRQTKINLEDKTTILSWVYFPVLENWPVDWQQEKASDV